MGPVTVQVGTFHGEALLTVTVTKCSQHTRLLYIGWSDVTISCSHNTISMLWRNTAYCVWSLVVTIFTLLEQNRISWFKKMSVLSLSYRESDVTLTNISQSLPHITKEKQLADDKLLQRPNVDWLVRMLQQRFQHDSDSCV